MSGESVIDIFQPYDHIPRHLQSDIGYPATSGPATYPDNLSDLAGYGGVKHRKCSRVYTCFYLLIATVFVNKLSVI